MAIARYTVHEANAPADLFYVRDEQTQRPVDKQGKMVVPATNANPDPPRADFLFTSRKAAAAHAAHLEAQDD